MNVFLQYTNKELLKTHFTKFLLKTVSRLTVSYLTCL